MHLTKIVQLVLEACILQLNFYISYSGEIFDWYNLLIAWLSFTRSIHVRMKSFKLIFQRINDC